MSEEEIRNIILNYDKPFSIDDILSYIININETNKSLIIDTINDMFSQGLIYYDKVDNANENNNGYAFVTDAYYKNNLFEIVKKKLKEYGHEYNQREEKIILSIFEDLLHDKILNLRKNDK